MGQLQTPVIPIADNTPFGEIPALVEVCLAAMERGDLPPAPVMLFEICDTPPWRHLKPAPSLAPERMLCIAADAGVGRALRAALAEVEKREPAADERPRVDITMKPNMPLKQIFKRMAGYPITVLSLAWEDNLDLSLYFLRTAFTISETQKEIPKHVI